MQKFTVIALAVLALGLASAPQSNAGTDMIIDNSAQAQPPQQNYAAPPPVVSGICDQAVGRYTAKHAVIWDKHGGVTDIGNLGAQLWNTPTNINQRGDVVGFAGTSNDDVDGNFLEAFIWTKKDGIQPLGFLPGDVHSEAYGINENRQVVGLSCDVDGNCRAFIWENGVMRDLNDLKPANYTAVLEQARDINEAGEIAGRSLDSLGVRRPFLAEPTH
jgi:probable HAF family extracellular repeat protein